MARILIVDDEATIRRILQKSLVQMGYEVAGAAVDGSDAIHLAKVLRPDLVLMDIVMPGEMDGIDAAKKIRAETGIPVIFLTGYADETFISRAQCAEPFGYIVKPYREEELKASIEMALHKKAGEKRLEQQISLYRDMTESPPFIFSVSSGDYSRLLYINPDCERLWHCPAEALTADPMTFLETVHPEDRPDVLKGITDQQSGKTTEALYRVVDADGGIRWIRECAYPVAETGGAVSHIVRIAEDVTMRRLMEQSVRDMAQRYRIVADHTYDWEFWRSPEGRFLYVSPSCTRITGYDADAFLSDPDLLRRIVHPEDRASFGRHDEDADGQMQPGDIDFRIVRKDGEIRWINHVCMPVFDDNGSYLGSRGSNRDITRRKQAEIQLLEKDRFLDKILRTTPHLIYIYDLVERRNIYMNHEGLEFLGYTGEQIRGMGPDLFERILHPDDMAPVARHHARLAAAADNVVLETEYRGRHAGDRWRTLRSRDTVFSRTDQGMVKQILGSTDDITEQRAMEEQRLIDGKLSSLGVMAGGIAHDYNNLLAVMLGNIEMAKDHVMPGDEAACALDMAEKAALAARGLTRQLITFAKGGAPVFKNVDLFPVLEESATIALRGSSCRCSFSIPDRLSPVKADEDQIGQVVRNLVLNARESMPRDGIVRVKAENVVLRNRSDLLLSDGDYVKVSVIDAGGGMDAETLPRIFDPYFSTKERGEQKGMGLGLTICRAVILKHNGALTVTSTPGHGTTISFYLPASPEPPDETKGPEKTAPLTANGRVLVMDDEEMVRSLFGTALRRVGYETALAQDGEQSVELYQAAMNERRPYDAVILDLTVPGGRGGVDTIKKLLVIDPGVRAVVTSGYADDPVMLDFANYGFRSAIVKPCRIADIYRAIQEAMR